jgi:hypothetical protein
MPAPAAPAKPRHTRRPLNWLRSLLKRPLKLERRGLQIHVVLAEPAPAPPPPESPGEALRRGHEALRDLLARHPEVRHLMRHLGFLEQALARTGSKALRSEVPLPVLRKAHEQLELLMRDDASPELSAFATRLERVIAERRRSAEDAPAAGALQVSEASHSLFDEMERSWTGQMPLAEVPSPPGRA